MLLTADIHDHFIIMDKSTGKHIVVELTELGFQVSAYNKREILLGLISLKGKTKKIKK